MSHIFGHVETTPQSAGILRFEFKGKTYTLPFIPPAFGLMKDMEIGFHPVKLSNNQVIATDVVLWSNHTSTDNAVDGLLGKKIEFLFKAPDIARLRNLMSQNYFTQDQGDVVTKSINYFQTPDFNSFYFKKGSNEPDPTFALEQIVAIISK